MWISVGAQLERICFGIRGIEFQERPTDRSACRGVPDQNKRHQLCVDTKHPSAEQKIAMEKARSSVSARAQTCKVLDLNMTFQCRLPPLVDVTDYDPEPWDQVQSCKYRSQVARCLFLSQDRADMTFIVQSCQRRSISTHLSLAKLQRRVRYLKREGQWRQIFSYGKPVER